MDDTTPSVALLPGSTRRSSIHRRLARVVADGLRARGVRTTVIDLTDYPMPIYHGDEEAAAGPPPAAVALHDLVAEHDGLVVLSPEYNGGPSPLLKNAIDWVTRVDRATLRRPLVGFASASPGSRGAAQVLRVMRSIGEHMRLPMPPDDFSLPHAGDALIGVGEHPELAHDDDVRRLSAWLDEYVDRLHERRVELLTAGEGAAGR